MADWKPEIRRRLQNLQLAPTREGAIVEELAQYLDDCYAELLASGATEMEAYQQTLAELSGVNCWRTNCGAWSARRRKNLSCLEPTGGRI